MTDSPSAAMTMPTRRDLRNFGFMLGSAVALVFGLLLPWLWSSRWPVWPWIVGALLVAAGAAIPQVLRPIYGPWMRFATILGHINNRIILGVVFFLIISPIGLVRRMLGKDSLRLRFDPQADSYRLPTPQARREDLERPF